MYNYRFDSDIVDKVISSCNASIKTNELNDIIDKLDVINNELYFDDEVYEYLITDYQKNQEKQNLHKKN